jgi:hypothetical protein
MSTKLQHLQSALNTSSGRTSAPTPANTVAAPAVVPSRAPSRTDAVNISAWLPKGFKKSLRLVQARKVDNATLQDLLSEALNDLFSKYDVPQVTQE